MKVLRRVVIYPHPVETVWTGLTDRQALAEWLMPTTFRIAEVGHRFRFQYDPEFLCPSGIVECEILELDPPHFMVWSWVNGPEPGKPWPPAMRVEWRLSPRGSGTRLELVQTGLEGQKWMLPFAMGFGWRIYFRKFLPQVLARIEDGKFRPGAIPFGKRAYKASNLPPEVAI